MLFSRRNWLQTVTAGFGSIAFASLCAEQLRAEGILAPKEPHFSARAKRVIFLCMRGGPSHMELFDHKPQLSSDHGKPGKLHASSKLLGSRWKFAQHGDSGQWISELLPNIAQQADKLCVIRSMYTDNENHPQALEQLHTGTFQFQRPSMGSWAVYGLGTENENLPGFVSLSPLTALGGLRYYQSSFLPAIFSATTIGEADKSIKNASIGNLKHPRLDIAQQRKQLDVLQAMNRDLSQQLARDNRVEGMIESYELAFRMQGELPQVMDLSGEDQATLELYGVDQPSTDNFGRQCLLARRFAEAGVRFIELTHTDWDHHGFLTTGMPARSKEIDQPIAALIVDLERRGLLSDTLVVWAGEFGRTPEDPTEDGRGHNSKGFSIFLAGGGVRGGISHGATDEYGYEAVENKVHIHDLHATMLHLLGLDHERLTFRHGGRDYRLTDVHGRAVKDIL
jgi:hypothetical protein